MDNSSDAAVAKRTGKLSKGWKIAIIVILSVVVLFGAGFGIAVAVPYIEAASFDVSGTPFDSPYRLDENGWFVENIPYSEYLVYGSASAPFGTVYDIRDYGASPDADFAVNRDAINRAIEAASAAGGGTVLVDGGKYTAASVRLLSDVTLHIAQDSELCNVAFGVDGSEHPLNSFIYAEGARNIVVEGPGRISGNGATYCDPQEDSSLFYPLDTFNLKAYVLEHRKRIMPGKEHEMERDHLLAFNDCVNVVVRNVELYEAGSWTVRAENNDGLAFDRVIINNNIRVANTDGIDIVGGVNTTVTNCFIAAGDDAICIKTEDKDDSVDGVLVENCEIMSLANCFKIGTATCGEIKNVEVRDCYFFMPGIAGGYAGIAIESVDGAKVSEVSVHDIVMYHITSPLLIWLGYREDGSEMSDIEVYNITATGCDLPSAVVGCKDGGKTYTVKNVTLRNFSVSYREAEQDLRIYRGDEVYSGSMNMGGYPEITRVSHKYFINHTVSAYYDLPVYGLYAAFTENLSVENFVVRPRSVETRPHDNLG